MSETVLLQTHPRDVRGSRQSAKLRKQGLVPAVVYGHKEANISVSVSALELDRAIRIQHARVLDLEIGGKKETVLIRELQWDHLGNTMLHVDFTRVSATDTVKVTVPIELRNTPKTTGGGVLDQPLHTLHIECSPTKIPEAIRVDLINLALGTPIHVRELKLPEGVKALDNPEAIVVQIKLPGADTLVPGMPTEGAGPEVIKKEKKGEDAEE